MMPAGPDGSVPTPAHFISAVQAGKWAADRTSLSNVVFHFIDLTKLVVAELFNTIGQQETFNCIAQIVNRSPLRIRQWLPPSLDMDSSFRLAGYTARCRTRFLPRLLSIASEPSSLTSPPASETIDSMLQTSLWISSALQTSRTRAVARQLLSSNNVRRPEAVRVCVIKEDEHVRFTSLNFEHQTKHKEICLNFRQRIRV